MCESRSPIISRSSRQEIKAHLENLGGGNQEDNIRNTSALPNYYLIRLSEDEFFNLIFLQNDEVVDIAPRGEDRRLRAVAGRALRLYDSGDTDLSENWNLEGILKRLKKEHPKKTGFELSPLLLRDARGSERSHHGGRWYIQDGCHRALAYAMVLLREDLTYQSQRAFCATASVLLDCSGR